MPAAPATARPDRTRAPQGARQRFEHGSCSRIVRKGWGRGKTLEPSTQIGLCEWIRSRSQGPAGRDGRGSGATEQVDLDPAIPSSRGVVLVVDQGRRRPRSRPPRSARGRGRLVGEQVADPGRPVEAQVPRAAARPQRPGAGRTAGESSVCPDHQQPTVPSLRESFRSWPALRARAGPQVRSWSVPGSKQRVGREGQDARGRSRTRSRARALRRTLEAVRAARSRSGWPTTCSMALDPVEVRGELVAFLLVGLDARPRRWTSHPGAGAAERRHRRRAEVAGAASGG